jgi:endonuclease/exonuclease/phosphatase family metal-dependent hydrolase
VEGGRFELALLESELGEFLVASIHAHTSLPEFLPPLEATFDAIRAECSGKRFVVGGDINTARSAEGFWPGYGHAEFWDRLELAGFHSSYWVEFGDEAITYVYPRGPFIGQADHVFIDEQTAGSVHVSSRVDENQPNLSDHRPLVVDIGPSVSE